MASFTFVTKPMQLQIQCCLVLLFVSAIFVRSAVAVAVAVTPDAAAVDVEVDDEVSNCAKSILDFTVSGCQVLHGTVRGKSVPSDQYWIELRNAYVAAVGPDQSTITWPPSTSHVDQQQHPFSGLSTDLAEIKYSPSHGRGVYAKTDIPSGTVLWNGAYHAVFPTECSFKTYLSKISWEQACDALQWCYGYDDDLDWDEGDNDDDDDDDDDEDSSVVACCLDEGSLFNDSPNGSANSGYQNPDDIEVTALRDILAGEEMLQNYGTFENVEFEWFDDLIEAAWGEDAYGMEEEQ